MPEGLVQFEITGLKELAKAFEQLPLEIQDKASKFALREGARVYQAAFKAAASRFTRYSGTAGNHATRNVHLATSIFASVKNIAGSWVGFSYLSRKAWYGRLLERTGAKEHLIPKRVGKGKPLHILGGQVFQQVKHPGFRPRPWMQPAFQNSSEQAIEAIRAGYWKYINNYAAKLKYGRTSSGSYYGGA